MTNTEKKIAEIREALEKATQGQWKIDEFGAVTDRKGNLIQWYDGKVVTAQKEDAHLIANAPEWLRFLLSQLDRKDEENRKLRKERDDAREQAQKYYRKFDDEVVEILRLQDELQSAQQEIERLKQERDRMIEGLRMCLFNHGCWREEDYVAYMRNILREIGVTVE